MGGDSSKKEGGREGGGGKERGREREGEMEGGREKEMGECEEVKWRW